MKDVRAPTDFQRTDWIFHTVNYWFSRTNYWFYSSFIHIHPSFHNCVALDSPQLCLLATCPRPSRVMSNSFVTLKTVFILSFYKVTPGPLIIKSFHSFSNILSMFSLMAPISITVRYALTWVTLWAVTFLGTSTEALADKDGHNHPKWNPHFFVGHMLGFFCTFLKLQLLHSFQKERTWSPKSSRTFSGHFVNKL